MMLVSPKWQTMWMESQHCSKTTSNVLAPSQQAKKLLEDLRESCSSPNKAVQLEALKCWGAWINNQNQDDWKLNTVCYTAVRPLLPKKLQPLQKDVDVCMLRFSLMWALLKKVENIMQLEGPQYILEVFLQSCLNWLSSCVGEEGKDVMELIFQLLLGIFAKEETIKGHRKEMFQPLSTDIFKVSKVFNRLADKFLNVFLHWKKVQDRKVILNLWKHFLEHCELSREHIAIPVWHKVFKLVSEMCSEKSEPVKDRLALLHGCATTLKSVLSSSKFLDYGNLLTTPCEGLMKKLVELCCWDCEEFYEGEMFVQGMEVSKVLSVKSVAISGFGLCIDVLNLLDEFSLRSLYWGVWCGLVDCYECLLSKTDKNHLTKAEMNFYRKLRGIAVNFELDKNYLGEECIREVEKYIRVLNICPCTCRSSDGKAETGTEVCDKNGKDVEVEPPSGHQMGQLLPKTFPAVAFGCFSPWKKPKRKPPVISVNSDLVKSILKTVDVSCSKWLLDASFRFISLRICQQNPNISLTLKSKNKKLVVVRTFRLNAGENIEKKAIAYPEKSEPDVEASPPKTRSRKRAEEEEKKKEMENQKRKTRKSFEIRVQEIVQKNKERKTEKNCKKSPSMSLREKRKKKQEADKPETPERKTKKQNKSQKMENYFKVITKKTVKKEETPKGKGKKKKEKEERRDEIVWKQTSLISMIKGRETSEGVRTRSKEKEVAGVRTKTKMIEGSPLAKMSPFKEVFHDHEYAKIELQDLKALERVIVNKEETEKKTAAEKNNKKVPEQETNAAETKRKTKSKGREGTRKSKRLSETPTPERETVLENIKNDENVADEMERESPKSVFEESFKTEENKSSAAEGFPEMVVDEGESPKESLPEGIAQESVEDVAELAADKIPAVESPPKEAEATGVENCTVQSPVNLDEAEESAEIDSTPRRGKKRFRILDSLKPSKKLRLEEPPEKLALEIEKENLKEVSPAKEEKTSKPSPKMISSRALRMIALVPESTRGQMHWETSTRVEVKKKAPNVDKNSRASKMLALLSENIVREVLETEEIAVEEVKSKDLATTPIRKTPTSSLRSPKTVKQRRSIRFDDTKNEMVVYETDTPPSQVLEGKEGRRRIKPSDVNSPNNSFV